MRIKVAAIINTVIIITKIFIHKVAMIARWLMMQNGSARVKAARGCGRGGDRGGA